MTIQLADVVLRKPEPRDSLALYTFKNDASVTSMLGGVSTGYSSADIDRWIEFHREQDNEAIWCIATRDSDQCIGHAGFYKIDFRARRAEYAILIGDSSWRGKGLGKSVSEAIIRFGFDELNLHRIELNLLADNEPALNLYKSLGFSVEGTLRDGQFKGGRYRDVTLMSLLNDST